MAVMFSDFSIFESKRTTQSFWILVVGFVLILFAATSMLSIYLIYGSPKVSQSQIALTVARDVAIAQITPVSQLQPVVANMNASGVMVTMERHPVPNSRILFLNSPNNVRHFVLTHPTENHFSIQVSNARWLNFNVYHHLRVVWLRTGLIVWSLILLFAFVFLAIWVLKRGDLPIRAFSRATERFSVDVQAPPLPLMGPPEVQEAIKGFNEMQNRIRRLLMDRTQMLAAISHDLRTPITRLQLRAEYLKDTNQYEKALADLNEMEQMISSILSFARDYARNEPMERFDLVALLQSVCDDLIDLGKKINLEMTFSRQAYLGRITAIKRALNNVIENAIKYGKKADIILIKQKGEIHIIVSDYGPGIPDDQFEKVFEPFYRVDVARSLQKSGTGLGLGVARDIIRSHGGDIQLQNRSPKGLVVTIIFPAMQSFSV